MSRPISINKSNYFILSGNCTDDEYREKIVNEYSKDVYKQMVDFTLKRFSSFIKYQSGKAIGELNQIVEENKDEKALTRYLQKDNGKSFPKNYLKLLELITYYCSFSKNVIINDSDRLEEIGLHSDRDTIEFVLNYFENNIKDKILSNWLNAVSTRSFEVSESFYEEVPKLIIGYSMYLKLLSKENKTKSAICDEIETKYLNNKTSNIRQEFDRYDTYFSDMENYINCQIKDETKVFLLNRSFDLNYI
ncbi:MAG: hypothetical protein QQN41_02880 [Nitrosopumilus sp.]